MKSKERFLKSEFGGSLQECITAYDFWIGQKDLSKYDSGIEKACLWCQAQWEIYQMAIKQFYGVKYNFVRTTEYFGVATDDERDWLFKVDREVK